VEDIDSSPTIEITKEPPLSEPMVLTKPRNLDKLGWDKIEQPKTTNILPMGVPTDQSIRKKIPKKKTERRPHQGRPVSQTHSREKIDRPGDSPKSYKWGQYPAYGEDLYSTGYGNDAVGTEYAAMETFADFAFLPGQPPPTLRKRKRIVDRRTSALTRSYDKHAQGHWDEFEDFDRVSTTRKTPARWRQRRQKLGLISQRTSMSVTPRHSLNNPNDNTSSNLPKRTKPKSAFANQDEIKAFCRKVQLSPSIGADIVASLDAGERLSTVTLLNRYGEEASLASLKGFYKRAVLRLSEPTR